MKYIGMLISKQYFVVDTISFFNKNRIEWKIYISLKYKRFSILFRSDTTVRMHELIPDCEK